MFECLFMNYMLMGSNPIAFTYTTLPQNFRSSHHIFPSPSIV